MLTRAPHPSTGLDRLTARALGFAGDVYLRHAAVLGAALFALYMLLNVAIVLVLPDSNWDMLAYLAVAEEGTYRDPQALHDFAYGAVREGVSAADWLALTDDGGGFRSHMAANAADFHSLLGMYRVKFLYAEILSTLSTVMSPVKAMQAVEVFSVLLFGGVVLAWLARQKLLALAPVVAAILMVLEFTSVARNNAPDLLCSALLLAGLFAYVERREVLTAVLVTLAVAVRPDNIVFVVLLAVLLVAYRERSLGVLAGCAVSLVAYFGISHWAGHPGWWPHLYFSSVEQQLNMDGFEPAFSAAAYAKAFANAVMRSIGFNTWVGVAVLALAGWFITWRAGFQLDRRAGILFAALVLGVLAKFTVFPIHDTRIYFPNLLPPFLLLMVPFAELYGRATSEKVRVRPSNHTGAQA